MSSTLTKVGERDDDALLVSRLIAGDDVALGVIYDRYAPVLFGIAFRVTGDRHLASEVVQEVVMCVWERPGRIDLSRGSLRTFLAVLAHRRSVDEVRREVRHDLTESRVADPPYDHGHEAAVVETLDRLQRNARLVVAMDRLPQPNARRLTSPTSKDTPLPTSPGLWASPRVRPSPGFAWAWSGCGNCSAATPEARRELRPA
jgi:RNA polymerase sigma-70 factor (ECF subfamily)